MNNKHTQIYDATQKAWIPLAPEEMWFLMGCANDACACEGDKEESEDYTTLVQSELNDAKGG